jgi:hypothetical protein
MAVYELPTTDVEIKGVRYRLTALPAAIGEKCVSRLTRTYGPVFAAGVREDAQTKERLTDVMEPTRVAAFATAYSTAASMEAFCRALTDEDTAYFSGLFKQRTEIWAGDGFVPIEKRPDLEGGSFVNNYGLLFLLIQAHLTFNFSSFLKDLGSALR